MSLITFGIATAGEPSDPIPGRDAQGETVKILDGQKSGDLTIDARGRGQAQVHLSIKNNAKRRLNVILPPGLVAASSVGQGPGGGGGGLQNMGLGAIGNQAGAFGQFKNGGNAVGFRSVAPSGQVEALPVAAGEVVEVDLPAVCLNFGLASPGNRDKLTLMDVDDYTRDVRIRTALRTLASLGTSQGTAQAVMWNVCNNVSFSAMVEKGEKVTNRHEIALASRFVEALNSAGTGSPIDASFLGEARLFVTVIGDGKVEKDARRLATDLEGLRIMGLTARVTASADLPKAAAPALHLVISLGESKAGETAAKVSVRGMLSNDGQWTNLGVTSIKDSSSVNVITGADLALALDRAIAKTFVSVKPAKKTIGSTSFKVENRLPFTISSVTLKTGNSPGAPSLTVSGVGIGPARTGIANVPAATASVERVELNGL
jgi:hypothetical protein